MEKINEIVLGSLLLMTLSINNMHKDNLENHQEQFLGSFGRLLVGVQSLYIALYGWPFRLWGILT